MNINATLRTLLAAASLLCATAASASVVTFAIGGTYAQGIGVSDLPATTISLGGAGSFVLDPGGSGQYFDFKSPGNGTFSTTADQIEGYYFLRSYQAGSAIDSVHFGADESPIADWDTILVNNVAAGAWTSSHSGYLAFKTATTNFGWINYDFTRVNNVSTIHFLSGAYETVANRGISAGASAVPEPASIALLGLGMLGFAAARRLTRKQ